VCVQCIFSKFRCVYACVCACDLVSSAASMCAVFGPPVLCARVHLLTWRGVSLHLSKDGVLAVDLALDREAIISRDYYLGHLDWANAQVDYTIVPVP
jgi:hypothetical protein